MRTSFKRSFQLHRIGMGGAAGPGTNSLAGAADSTLHALSQLLQQRLQGLQQPVMPSTHRLKARNNRIVFMAHLPFLVNRIM